MYNIEQLRMFVEAADLGSFSASARKLGKVQSAVSQGIGNLEVDFNVQLFNRTTRKPTLTREGKRLYKLAKTIVMQTEELNIAVQSICNEEEDVIRIAFDDSFLAPPLVKIIDKFTHQFPATELELISTLSTNIVSLIREEKADIGLMVSQFVYNQDMASFFIGNIPFIAICHPEHPLANEKNINEMQLIIHRQLLLRGDENQPLDQFPLPTAKTIWANSFNSIKQVLITSKLGWAFIPSHLVIEEIASGHLSKIDLSFDYKEWCPPVELITAKGVSKGAALTWLENELKSVLE